MPKPERTYILQQDQHLQNLRKIIKRDFFPASCIKQSNSQAIDLSLNQYMANFKSNQNQLFSNLIQADKKKWKQQHWWFDKQDQVLKIEQQKLLKIKNQSHQYQNMIKKVQNNANQFAITNQQAKNSIFFNRQINFGSYLGQQYQNAKKLFYKNCSFHKQIQNLKKKQNLQSDEQQQPNIMTWGQVNSTPIRIGGLKQFKMQQQLNKDKILEQLNHKITKNKKQKQLNVNKKSQIMIKLMRSMTPSHQKSSYMRNSSIHRVLQPQTPLNIDKNNKNSQQMKGLLNIKK